VMAMGRMCGAAAGEARDEIFDSRLHDEGAVLKLFHRGR
jgi:hypothetical protein